MSETVTIGEIYKEIENIEYKAYKEADGCLDKETFLIYYYRKKELITDKLKKIRNRTIHSFSLETDFEKELLEHYGDTDHWVKHSLNDFVREVFYLGLKEFNKLKGTDAYKHFIWIDSPIKWMGTSLVQDSVKPQIANKEVKAMPSNIIQFPQRHTVCLTS